MRGGHVCECLGVLQCGACCAHLGPDLRVGGSRCRPHSRGWILRECVSWGACVCLCICHRAWAPGAAPLPLVAPPAGLLGALTSSRRAGAGGPARGPTFGHESSFVSVPPGRCSGRGAARLSGARAPPGPSRPCSRASPLRALCPPARPAPGRAAPAPRAAAPARPGPRLRSLGAALPLPARTDAAAAAAATRTT